MLLPQCARCFCLFVSKRAITLFVLNCRPTRAPKLATIWFGASSNTCVQACYHSQPRAL